MQIRRQKNDDERDNPSGLIYPGRKFVGDPEQLNFDEGLKTDLIQDGKSTYLIRQKDRQHLCNIPQEIADLVK